jgi:hypothetical protein
VHLYKLAKKACTSSINRRRSACRVPHKSNGLIPVF